MRRDVASKNAPTWGKPSASGSDFGQMFGALGRRLRRKVVAIVPALVGALLLLAAMSLLLYLLEPYLPAALRNLASRMTENGLSASCESMSAIFASNSQPFLFVGLHVLQVVVVPIPGQLLGLLGGCLFGFWEGLLLTMLGLMLGSALAMGASRLVGEALVRRFVSPAVLARFDKVIGADGAWGFFVIFLLPTFPDDAICFMAGLTRIPLHRLLLACVVGRLPGMVVLTLVGAGAGAAYANLVLAAATVVAIGMWLFSEELEAMLSRVVATAVGGRGFGGVA